MKCDKSISGIPAYLKSQFSKPARIMSKRTVTVISDKEFKKIMANVSHDGFPKLIDEAKHE